MKILLTGSKGNLGTAIKKFNTYNIVEVDRDSWGNLDNILAKGVDVVIHTAYDLKKKIADFPSSVLDSNLITTTKLLESMIKHKTSRIIFLSSCAVYGDSVKTNEEAPCFPISINGMVKLLNEKIIGECCSQNKIKYEIYRVFNMYGGNDHFSILFHLKKCIENDQEFQLNNYGLSQRDFVHVEDVARIILKLIAIQHPYTHMNIGTGVTTRISEIIDIVKGKYPYLKIKDNVIHEAEYSRADITKLRTLVDYKFINIKDHVRISPI